MVFQESSSYAEGNEFAKLRIPRMSQELVMLKVQPKHTADSLLNTKNIFTPQYHVSQ